MENMLNRKPIAATTKFQNKLSRDTTCTVQLRVSFVYKHIDNNLINVTNRTNINKKI